MYGAIQFLPPAGRPVSRRNGSTSTRLSRRRSSTASWSGPALKLGASLDYSMGGVADQRASCSGWRAVRDAVGKGRCCWPEVGRGRTWGRCFMSLRYYRRSPRDAAFAGDIRPGGFRVLVFQRGGSGGARHCHAIRVERRRLTRTHARRGAGRSTQERERQRIVRRRGEARTPVRRPQGLGTRSSPRAEAF